MDLRYIDSNNVVHKPEPKQLIMAYDYAKEVSTAQELWEPSAAQRNATRGLFHLIILSLGDKWRRAGRVDI